MRSFGPTFESYFLLFDLIKEELKEDDRKCYRYADMIYPTILGAKRPFQITFSVRPCASQLGSSLPPHRRFLDQCQTYIYLILFSGEDLYRCANSDCDFAASNVSSFKVSLHFCSETKFLRVE